MASPDGWNPTSCKPILLGQIRLSLPEKGPVFVWSPMADRSDWRERRSLWVSLKDGTYLVPELATLRQGHAPLNKVLPEEAHGFRGFSPGLHTGCVETEALETRTRELCLEEPSQTLNSKSIWLCRPRANWGPNVVTMGPVTIRSSEGSSEGRRSLWWVLSPPTNVKYI